MERKEAPAHPFPKWSCFNLEANTHDYRYDFVNNFEDGTCLYRVTSREGCFMVSVRAGNQVFNECTVKFDEFHVVEPIRHFRLIGRNHPVPKNVLILPEFQFVEEFLEDLQGSDADDEKVFDKIVDVIKGCLKGLYEVDSKRILSTDEEDEEDHSLFVIRGSQGAIVYPFFGEKTKCRGIKDRMQMLKEELVLPLTEFNNLSQENRDRLKSLGRCMSFVTDSTYLERLINAPMFLSSSNVIHLFIPLIENVAKRDSATKHVLRDLGKNWRTQIREGGYDELRSSLKKQDGFRKMSVEEIYHEYTENPGLTFLIFFSNFGVHQGDKVSSDEVRSRLLSSNEIVDGMVRMCPKFLDTLFENTFTMPSFPYYSATKV